MSIIVVLDYEEFHELFISTQDEPDAWRRVAAHQYGVKYTEVTGAQRTAMKQLYYMYAYSAGPMKLCEALGVTDDGINDSTGRWGE